MTTLTRTFPASASHTITLDTSQGDVTVTSSDRDDIELVVHTDGQIDENLLDIREQADTLDITIPHLLDPNGGRGFTFQLGKHLINFGDTTTQITVTMRVPNRCSVEIRTKSGDVRLDGPFDRVHVATASGDIQLSDAREADLTAASGDMAVERIADRLSASAASGDITIKECPSVVAKTASGDMVIAGISDCVVASSASGDIRVTVATSHPVWTELSTVSGDLNSRLSPRGEPNEGEPHVRVQVSTVSGDIDVLED